MASEAFLELYRRPEAVQDGTNTVRDVFEPRVDLEDLSCCCRDDGAGSAHLGAATVCILRSGSFGRELERGDH